MKKQTGSVITGGFISIALKTMNGHSDFSNNWFEKILIEAIHNKNNDNDHKNNNGNNNKSNYNNNSSNKSNSNNSSNSSTNNK